PLYDALHDMLTPEQVARRLEMGEIEIAPLAFMRGRTLSNAYVILDEAQNTNIMQMKMFLTRLGEGSLMVVTGDLTQIDLPKGQVSGLQDAVKILQNIDGINFIYLDETDTVRHPLVKQMIKAYAKADRNKT
ncbi:MAG: PhoH family protein, partial [Alphaproteobacteria bacterium]|nr:PhoH family protein [Alphaproteobacteria bacterium]